MTLFDESELRLVIVSPYNNFINWTKMKKHLASAVNRNIKISYFIRDQKEPNLRQFEEIGITPIIIKDLHAKVYLNEKYAIVSSMNMLEYSDTNSIDFAYKTESSNEYDEVIDFINKYIDKETINTKNDEVDPLSEKEMEILEMMIKDNFRDKKITNEKTYLFSKDIIPHVELFISNGITIKKEIHKPTDKDYFDAMYGECYRQFSRTCKISLSVIDKRYYANITPQKEIYDKDRYGVIIDLVKRASKIIVK